MESYGVHRKLPEGWEWQHWEDGSGSLRAPDGKHYFQYDLNTREFKLSMEHPVWEWHPDLSRDEFICYAEKEVLEYEKMRQLRKPYQKKAKSTKETEESLQLYRNKRKSL